jgi:hypothetical protein
MSNTARHFSAYHDFEDEEEIPVRRANVPGATRPALPAYRVNVVGDQPPMGRVGVPRPFSDAGVGRPPAGMTGRYVMPKGGMALPAPAPTFNRPPAAAPARRQRQSQGQNWLNRIDLSNANMPRLLLIIGGGILAVALITFVVSNLLNWWNVWQDDMTYGRPRTMQMSGWVGHNESTGLPTNFIAQNVNGEINIYEIPGGDTSKMTVIKGPRLFAKNAELIPVKIRLEDVNADAHVDLIASADGQQFVYLNDGGKFRPVTSEERGRLKFSGGN